MIIKLTNTFHELKLNDEYKEAVKAGIKNFEVRKNDKNYQVGDRLAFKGIHVIYVITYVLKDIPQFGLDRKYCVFGFRRLREWEIQSGEAIL